MKSKTTEFYPKTIAIALAWVACSAAQAQLLDVAFSNMPAAALGYSSPDPNTYYGALVSLTRTGTLGSVGFSLFNGAASGGSIVAGTMKMSIYDASQGYSGGPVYLPLLATLSIPLNLSSSPLLAGYYLTYSTGDLSSQNISLTSKVLLTQQFELTQGQATRFGIAASGTAPSTGSSTGQYFLSNSQNAAGFYSANGGGNAFPLYQITLSSNLPVVPEPETYAAVAGLVLVGWSAWRRFRLAPSGS